MTWAFSSAQSLVTGGVWRARVEAARNRSAEDVQMRPLDPEIVQSLVLQRDSSKTPLGSLSQLAPLLQQLPIKHVKGLHASAGAFAEHAQRIAPRFHPLVLKGLPIPADARIIVARNM